MAFDISTARPERQGFDISTAQPVDELKGQQKGRNKRGQQLRRQAQEERESFLQSLPPERRALVESVSPAEAAAIGLGRGFTNIARGLGIADKEDELVKQAMEELREAQPVMTAGEIAGEAAPFLAPGGAVSAIPRVAGRVAATAGLGALEGGLIARGKDREVSEQLASAGVGGAVAGSLELVLPVIGRLGGKVIRRSLNKLPDTPVVNDLGQPSDELKAALDASGMSFDDLLKTARDEVANQTDDALIASSPLSSNIDKTLRQAAPTIEQLKLQARSIYKNIDNLGAAIAPESITNATDKIIETAKKAGFDPGLHPKAAAVVSRLATESGQIKTMSEMDTLRRVMQGASKSLEPDEARIGVIMLDEFDSYLDDLGSNDFVGDTFKGVGGQYKEARQLWRKAKKSELISEAVAKADIQASGFENGLRVQFRSILNNRKKRRNFNNDELDAMRKVVKGGRLENAAKFLGKFGISEQQATSMLGASIGVGGGAALGSAIGGTGGAGVGALLVPAIGQVSKKLAQKLTRNNAQFADIVVRAGKDGRKIVQAYLKQVPKDQRNSAELTQLLMRPNISLKAIKNIPDPVVKDSLYLLNTLNTDQLRQAFGLVGAAAAAEQITQEEQ